jgi:broad specificity phosphatase PhoE
MKVILVRHGNKQHSESTLLHERRSVNLSPLGIQQIQALGNELKSQLGNNISQIIYSSPYTRAIQTAEILRNTLGASEIRSQIALEEFYPYDDYNLEKSFRRKLMIDSMIKPDSKIHHTEWSLNNHLDRLTEFMQSLESIHDDEYVLFSSHGALIRNLYYRHVPSKKPSPDKIFEAKISTGGYSLVEIINGQLEFLCFDYSNHLPTNISDL